MKINYRPDETSVHMCYGFQAQKESADETCCDRVSGKFHTRGEFESMIRVLKKLGFKVKATKQVDTTVMYEKFPDEPDDEE